MTVNPAAIIRYQYDNHLGSASLELDESAGIISYEEYHPFGTSSYRSGRTETETSQKRYKYVGKERDEETGLYYYGFRYYAAWLCRFVSVDPLQFDYPHYTPFQYAGNKPITYIDLDGLEELNVNNLKSDSIQLSHKSDTTALKYFRKKATDLIIKQAPSITKSTLDRIADHKLNKNIENGLKVDNFGAPRQSPRKYKNTNLSVMEEKGEYINMGGRSSRGNWSTIGMGNETKSIKKLKLIGKGVAEVAGPMFDLLTIAKVLQDKETPFAIINPISFMLTEQLDEVDQFLFETALQEGYKSIKSYMENCKSCDILFESKQFIYLQTEDFMKVMNGKEQKNDNLTEDYGDDNNPWAVLIEWKSKNEFTPIAAYKIND
ncbi:RHS repeat-associated core domain-containing protein [Labilibaculum manganireducens]|uniref:RHS repeat domain-containing protein n=1 Tax=Labilibaculum manganireducens TaxID=1940525 RepID=UPI0029F4B17E|nr:RHS repeat-associated core domain-containing protein [Labilibaculum manganireducens]